MECRTTYGPYNRLVRLGIFGLLVALGIGLASCGSGSNSSSGMGSANVTMSDPPFNGTYSSVWVTVDDVSASVSGTSDTGWVSLVSNLSDTSGAIKAVQLDLMHLPANGKCLLAQLGSTSSLPAGDYQQIRLKLVANDATGVTLLSPSGESTTNQCANVNAWNCVLPNGGALTTLNLDSQAQTGEKIPPGQVMGGPIHVAAGSSVDINLDFNADRSIIQEGTGLFRLHPVLVAYQVSQNLTGISGQVVQGTVVSNALQVSTTGVPNANVALEMSANNPVDGSNSVDLIGNSVAVTDSNGNFDFCPLPAGPFDVVADAGSGSTPAYNATIVTGVPNGTQLSVPLLAEAASGAGGTLAGLVTATPANSSATSISANVYALQQATASVEFAVPLLAGSNPMIAQVNVPCSAGACTTVAPVFSLVLPASNPLVGAYAASGITWTLPSLVATPSYKVEATCTGSASPPPLAQFSSSQTVTAGATTTMPAGQPPSLTGCE